MGSANAVLLVVIIGAMMFFTWGLSQGGLCLRCRPARLQDLCPHGRRSWPPAWCLHWDGDRDLPGQQKVHQGGAGSGKASFVLGLCFISEGPSRLPPRIPMRVIPACMVGGAPTGALLHAVRLRAGGTHGGLFVLFIPNAISHVMMYILAIAAGSLVTGVAYAMLKRGEEQAKLATA